MAQRSLRRSRGLRKSATQSRMPLARLVRARLSVRATAAAIGDRHVAEDLFDVTAAADEAGFAAVLAGDALAHDGPSVLAFGAAGRIVSVWGRSTRSGTRRARSTSWCACGAQGVRPLPMCGRSRDRAAARTSRGRLCRRAFRRSASITSGFRRWAATDAGLPARRLHPGGWMLSPPTPSTCAARSSGRDSPSSWPRWPRARPRSCAPRPCPIAATAA